eukprot:12001389-Prorocentrum_lima.AAC.1
MLTALRPTSLTPLEGSSSAHPNGKNAVTAHRGAAHGAFPLRWGARGEEEDDDDATIAAVAK